MKHSNCRYIGARAAASHLAIALSCASVTSACSGYYPLGESSQHQELVDGEGADLGGRTGDARVPATLAPPHFSMSVPNDGVGPLTLASVGDIDGDGRDDMAVSTWAFSPGLSYVHLRYGGARPSDATEAFAFEQSGAQLTLGDGQDLLYVFAAGDVDADGYDDLLVKTNECAAERPSAGAYLVYGGPERLQGVLSLVNQAAHFAPPYRPSDPNRTFMSCDGYPLASTTGDIDGDGFDDILITSAPLLAADGRPEPGTGEGVYVFYGKAERFAGEIPFAAADASFHGSLPVNPYALGDVNGDGLADVIVGPDVIQPDAPGSFFVPGRAERWRGARDLAAAGTLLEGAFVDTIDQVHADGDIDGDGTDDVVLRSADFKRHLFYGQPDIFASGFDPSASDATFGGLAGLVYVVGDLDGDGDDELLDEFSNPDSSIAHDLTFFSSNIALASGSRERLSGVFVFPEDEVLAQAPDGFFEADLDRFRRSGRTLDSVLPAGDLDGDGAADLFTTSYFFEILDEGSFDQDAAQIHVHYGTPATLTTLLR